MLLQRVITAVVLLIIIIGALLISPLAFTAVAAIAIGCCFWEWLRICKWNNGVAMVCGVLLAAFLFFLEYVSPAALQTIQSGNGLMIITAVATVLWAVITAVIFTRRASGWMVPKGIGALLAWIFVPAAWFSLMYLFREKGTIYRGLFRRPLPRRSEDGRRHQSEKDLVRRADGFCKCPGFVVRSLLGSAVLPALDQRSDLSFNRLGFCLDPDRSSSVFDCRRLV